MRAFKHEFQILLAALLCASLVPIRLLADDKDTSNSPAKSAPPKPDSPAPLTERERWMLDRMEQLERRVAELESKSNPAAAKAVESTGQPAPASAANAAPAAADVLSPAAAGASVKPPGHVGAAKPEKAEPFAFADFTWLNGNARTKESPMDTKFFTPEVRADVDYIYDFNHPKDDSIGGSSEVFRSNEVHVTQLGVGGDFHYDNVRARLMTQFGLR